MKLPTIFGSNEPHQVMLKEPDPIFPELNGQIGHVVGMEPEITNIGGEKAVRRVIINVMGTGQFKKMVAYSYNTYTVPTGQEGSTTYKVKNNNRQVLVEFPGLNNRRFYLPQSSLRDV